MLEQVHVRSIFPKFQQPSRPDTTCSLLLLCLPKFSWLPAYPDAWHASLFALRKRHPGRGLEDIVPLFAAVEAACKGISMLVQRAAIAGATGMAAGGGENAGGDQQKKLDVVSNDLLKGFLARSGVVRVLASEEVGRCWCVLHDGNAYHTRTICVCI